MFALIFHIIVKLAKIAQNQLYCILTFNLQCFFKLNWDIKHCIFSNVFSDHDDKLDQNILGRVSFFKKAKILIVSLSTPFDLSITYLEIVYGILRIHLRKSGSVRYVR